MKNWILKKNLLFVFFITGVSLSAQLKAGDDHDDEFYKYRGMFYTLDQVIDRFNKDLEKIETPKKALFSNYTQSENLPTELERIAVKKLVGSTSKSNIALINCMECMALEAHIENDEFIIERGLTTDERLKELLEKNKTNFYADVHINKITDQLVMTVTIHDYEKKEVVFSKEYKTHIYKIKSSGLILSLDGGAIILNGGALMGGELSFGQKVSGLGDFGLNVGSFFDANNNLIISGSLSFNPDFNDIFGGYWRLGALHGVLRAGITTSRISTHIHTGLGLKIKLGTFFYILTEARFFINVMVTTAKSTSNPDILNFSGSVPFAFRIGVGIDVG